MATREQRDPEGDRDSRAPFVHEARKLGLILGLFVGVMWLEEAVDQLFFMGSLDRYGIEPRTLNGLRGILLCPFLHGGFNHLTGNTLPLVVLGFVIMIRRKRDLLWVSVASQLVGGAGVWLIGGTNTLHFGASILVFGYLGYLSSRGVFERHVWAILGSLVVLFLYGGVLWGMLPGDPSVSWEGHLFGFLGGVLAARTLRRAPAQRAAPTTVKPAPQVRGAST
jgi:membrane associated rhomboid family serine protease